MPGDPCVPCNCAPWACLPIFLLFFFCQSANYPKMHDSGSRRTARGRTVGTLGATVTVTGAHFTNLMYLSPEPFNLELCCTVVYKAQARFKLCSPSLSPPSSFHHATHRLVRLRPCHFGSHPCICYLLVLSGSNNTCHKGSRTRAE